MLLASLLLACPQGASFDPAAELAALVDLPTPEERAARARELARRKEVSLEDWRAAMAGFGDFPPAAPGVHTERAELVVDGEVEPTDLTIFVPSSYAPGTPAPMVLLLHGAGGDGRSMAALWRETAERAGLLLLAPTDRGAAAGYTFQPRERLAALAALRWFRRRYDVDENRIHLSGVSRGGHLAWDLATRYPDRWAAFAPMIGGPSVALAGGRNNLRLVENVAPLAVRDLQGAQDDPRLLRNLRLAFQRLERAGAEHAALVEFADLGHDYRFDAVDWPAFLAAAARDPRPARLEHRACRLEEGRNRWLRITRFARSVKEEFKPRVDAARWNAAADETARLLLLQEKVDEATARLAVERLGPGRFRAEGSGVARFELLLEPEDLDEDGRVTVAWHGKERRLRARPGKEVLLAEFAERFDRRFRPVAAVEVR